VLRGKLLARQEVLVDTDGPLDLASPSIQGAQRKVGLSYSAATGLVARVGAGPALVLLGDTSDLATKLAVLEELANTVDLAGYSQVDLTVPERPALTPLPNSDNN